MTERAARPNDAGSKSATRPPPVVAAPSLSIIVPAYNESARLPDAIGVILAWLAHYPGRWEVLIADDGSTDGSTERVRRDFPPVQVLGAARNAGKGAAVRRGMLAATGDLRLFTDADLSTPIDELGGMIEALESGGYEIVIASRALPGSRLLVRQPWWREFSGRLFNRLVQPLAGLPYCDTQCGFKLFTRRAAECVFPRQRCTTWAFDVELLMLARVYGLRVLEHPVRWRNDAASKVCLARAAPRMLADILRFRWRHFMGEMARETEKQD